MAADKQYVKGQRVQIIYKGKLEVGTVEKGGAGTQKIKVVLDDGKTVLKGSANAFNPSNLPAPKNHAISWKKGDRVTTSYQGQQVSGTVEKSGKGPLKIKVLLDDGKTILTGAASSFKPCQSPPPDHLTVGLKKGDRVQIVYDGKVLVGTIKNNAKGLGRAKMVVDGGENEIAAPISSFEKSDVPLPKDPAHPMDRWTVESYKVVAGHDDTEPFVAQIAYDGKKVIRATNDGWGGCNLYAPLKPEFSSFCDQLMKDSEKWAIDHGAEAPVFEAAGSWIEWYVYQRPYGSLASQFWAKRSKPIKF